MPQVVAVKVRHPGVSELMLQDFALLQRLARWASALPGLASLRLEESVRQFGGPLREQLDLSAEARNLTLFAANFKNRPDVRFPEPLQPLVSVLQKGPARRRGCRLLDRRARSEGWPGPRALAPCWSSGQCGVAWRASGCLASPGRVHTDDAAALQVSPSVLVESYEEGAPISSYLKSRSEYCAWLARSGVDTFLHMMLRHNFIHSDLHPGAPPPRPCAPHLRGCCPCLQHRRRPKPARAPAASAPRLSLSLCPAGNILVRPPPPPPPLLARVAESLPPGEGWAGARRWLLGLAGCAPQLVLLDAGMVVSLSPEDQVRTAAAQRSPAHPLPSPAARHPLPEARPGLPQLPPSWRGRRARLRKGAARPPALMAAAARRSRVASRRPPRCARRPRCWASSAR